MATPTVSQALGEVIQHHGYAAAVEGLAAEVGWQARWYAADKAKRIAKVAQMLAEAAGLLKQLEAEEDAE